MTLPALSLAQLIALPLNPAQLLRLAADTGCQAAGVRLLSTTPGGVAYPLMDDPAGLREALAVVADTGVGVFDLEVAGLTPQHRTADFLPFFDVGRRLGARAVLVAGLDDDEARLIASYAAFCEAAAPFGLTCDLEFMPWTAVPNLRTAKRIVGAVRQPNAGVLVDALHFFRSDSRLDELDDLPREWLHYAQICDGPAQPPATVEGLVHAARHGRWLPGEGDLDLTGLFARLPADLPVSIEVPNDERAQVLGHAAWAQQAVDAARRVLQQGVR